VFGKESVPVPLYPPTFTSNVLRMSPFLLGEEPATHPLTVNFHVRVLILGCYALTQGCTRREVFRNEEKEAHN